MEVLGYAGSADFSDTRRFSHVDMVRGIRSPGSTSNHSCMRWRSDEGLIHSESLMADTPQSFGGYDPEISSEFSGPVSVSEALQRSLNVPAVDLLDRLGPARFTARLSAAGLRLRLAERGESEFECDTWRCGNQLGRIGRRLSCLGHEGHGRNAAYHA